MEGQGHLIYTGRLDRLLFPAWLAASFMIPSSVNATALNLAQSPLFLGSTTVPNVMLMMDDSGSMDWEILTRKHWDLCAYFVAGVCASSNGQLVTTGEMLDLTNNGGYDDFLYIYNNPTNLYSDWSLFTFNSYDEDSYEVSAETSPLTSTVLAESWETNLDWRVFSSDLNTVYYDPDITYSSWPGSTYPDASFTAANENSNNSGTTRDLTNSIYIVADDDKGFSGTSGPMSGGAYENVANGLVDIWDSHTIYNIGSSEIRRYRVTAIEASDGSITGLSYSDLGAITDITQVNNIKQNFANWYQYHRRRYFNLKGSLASLISTSPNYRYMLGAINSSSVLVEAPTDNDSLSSHNDNLISSMLEYDLAQQGTPLRQGLNLAGNYFMSTDSNAPIQNACQLNFTVLMTDGFWNGSFTNAAIGDQDSDTFSQTLADVADYYYDTDLRTDLANTVPTSSNDSNVQQHMNTITLSFGLQGSLSDSNGDGWPDVNGVNLTSNSTLWGNPTTSTAFQEKVNDIWHAAFNSRGAYVDVTASSTLLDSLNSVLSTIDERVGSAASVTLSAGSMSETNVVYQSKFSSIDWSGDVQAFPINTSTGVVSSTATWSAETQLDAKDHDERNIIFSFLDGTDSYTGRSFTYTNLPSDWLTALRTNQQSGFDTDAEYEQAIVDYLRGDSTYNNGDTFRARSGKLGDIVHSSPVYVGPPSETAKPYSTDADYTIFKSTYNTRDPMIYVGANDGMLHVFDASDGEEELAYIASGMKDNLYKLAAPSYEHHYYFNATPVIKDAWGNFTDGNEWKTVLVTGFGAGAKGLAALDVTDPETFDATNADIIPLWEFKEEDRTGDDDAHNTTHPYLGHIYGTPAIAKMNDGNWAVITGNGYNSIENGSSNGKAVLYILDITTGEPIKILETSAGSGTNPNGLSESSLVDTDDDGDVDLIYAGDRLGNLWKFDVSGSNTSSWMVSYTNAENVYAPLFAAGSTQPITAGLTIGRHPTGRGRMIYFGTGQYLTSSDNTATGQNDQAFYGIWDKDTSNSDFNSSLTSATLLEQDITLQTTFTVAVQDSEGNNASSSTTVTARETSRNIIDWDSHNGWYLPLVDPNGTNNGERVISTPQLRAGRIIFTTMQPSSTACQTSGQSWLMELDAASGARLTTVSIDLNQDGQFDAYDYSYLSSGSLQCSTTTCVPPSGILYNQIITAPAILTSLTSETKYISGSSGSIEKVNENLGSDRLGRQGWRQIYLFLQ